MSREEIAATVNTITGLIGALTYAPAADKAEIYAGLRLRLTLQPGQPGPFLPAPVPSWAVSPPAPQVGVPLVEVRR